MSNRYADAAARARQLTNQDLAGEIARITSLSDADIESLLPTKLEKEQFADLLAIVGGAADTNAKVAALRSNVERVGPVLLKVLRRVILP